MVIILIGRKTLKTQVEICQCDYFVGKNLTLVTEVEQKHVCPSVWDQTTACVSCFFLSSVHISTGASHCELAECAMSARKPVFTSVQNTYIHEHGAIL